MAVLITKQNTVFDKELKRIFEREGYTVFIAGENEPTEYIDMYIDTSNYRSDKDTFKIRDGLDEKIIREVYEENVLNSMRLLENYLPYLEKGTGKRICFLTSHEASINETTHDHGYAYKMSKAAMHNLYPMVMNILAEDGYTIRIYDPLLSNSQNTSEQQKSFNNIVCDKLSAEGAFNYFVRKRGTEHDDPLRNDENRIVFRDALGREHTW
ncbi:MAG: hypothetical protein LBC71_08935 [Oscillospiraceae bacterium]|jgi:hypothetical protein|nr:hypothetical protein [Oscillospiraceae bacterium]